VSGAKVKLEAASPVWFVKIEAQLIRFEEASRAYGWATVGKILRPRLPLVVKSWYRSSIFVLVMTVISTELEVVAAPRLSVAMAVSE
jgi:hypothetical protein